MKESSDSIVTRRCCWLCNIYRYTSDKRWVNRIAFLGAYSISDISVLRLLKRNEDSADFAKLHTVP